MKMKYPKYYIYEKLYRRYFLKGVDYFIKEANLTYDDRAISESQFTSLVQELNQSEKEVRDLFSVPEDYYLAHCISADFGMGK